MQWILESICASSQILGPLRADNFKEWLQLAFAKQPVAVTMLS